MNAKELREKLAALAAVIYQLRDKFNTAGYVWTAEDEANFTKAHNEYEALKKRAQVLEASERIQAELAAPVNDPAAPKPGREDFVGKSAKRKREEQRQAPTEEDRSLAFQGWTRHQLGLALKRRHVEACRRLRFNPHASQLRIPLARSFQQLAAQYRSINGEQHRAQSINIETAGGYSIPMGFITSLEVAQLAYANVQLWCDTLTTDSGNDLPWPTVNDTTNKGRMLAENTQVTETDVTLGQMVLHAFKATTDLVLIPAELIEDNAVLFVQELGRLLGTRMGRLKADKLTFGTGAGEPTGYVTAATLGYTAASSTAIAWDEIYELKHSVDPAYRPGAMFTFHDNTLKTLKKLKDGFGRYLWQASTAGGAPDTIDNDPYGINQSMASTIASGNITVCYGQMKNFKARMVAQVRMRRLIERYADYDQEGFVGFYRFDSDLLDAGTHPIKYLKQP